MRSKTRICPDCGIRELEKRFQYCSECGIIRRQTFMEINRFNWKTQNPEKYIECYMKSTHKYREKIALTVSG